MIQVRRSTAEPFTDEPNTWRPLRGKSAWAAIYVCPNGHAGMIDVHTIGGDGTVKPSVVCEGYPAGYPEKGSAASPCTFHDHLKLKGWREFVQANPFS